MSETTIINSKDVLHQIKLSFKITEIIEEILCRQVIESAAASAGIKTETEELQQAADQFRLINRLENANETLAWLEKKGLSVDDFEELVHNTVISGKLAAHLFEDKVEPYFFENYFDYMCVAIYELIIDDKDLAIELFYMIQQDEMSFSDVAHEYIQDTELRRKGGYRGIVTRNDLKPEISAAVFAVKPPHLLKPIVTSLGVHLILVEEIIQPQLDQKLSSKILSDLFHTWLKQQTERLEVIHKF
jgi:PPIC-type PPIASE domain